MKMVKNKNPAKAAHPGRLQLRPGFHLISASGFRFRIWQPFLGSHGAPAKYRVLDSN
jgi:hypothetical protein